jgi:predicted phage-related endonuclease
MSTELPGRLKGELGFIEPGSPAHARYISPSKVASICGVSRWESTYTLWTRMKGWAAPKPRIDIFDAGLAMEMAMAELWKIRHEGWRLSKGEVQYETDRYGFPALATIDRRASRGRSKHVLEMKIARDMEEFGDPDLAGDAPADYVLQVIAQMLISGLRSPAHLMVLGPFYKERVYTVEFDTDIANWMVGKCKEFYDSLELDEPPPLDDSLSTYKTVKELHPLIDGSIVNAPVDLITQIRELREELGPMESKLRGLKTQLLDLMGNAQKAVLNGETVARRQANRTGISLVVL